MYNGLHDEHVIVVVHPNMIKRKRHHPPYIDCFFDKKSSVPRSSNNFLSSELAVVYIYIFFFFFQYSFILII